MSKEINTQDEGYFDSSNMYVFLYKYKLHLLLIIILTSIVSAIISLNIQEKYKSVAIDNDWYKKIEDLTTALSPGITLSRAQVVRILVNNKVLEDEHESYENGKRLN